MKFVATISSIAVLLASGLNALTITQPTDALTVSAGLPLDVLVVNDVGESYVTAEVAIASSSGSLVINLPVGTPQSIYLPCNVLGQTSIVARTSDAVSNRVLIMVSPALAGIPCLNYGCGVPCGNPCEPVLRPRSSRCRSSRNSRRGCVYYTEGATEVTEFKPEDYEQQEA